MRQHFHGNLQWWICFFIYFAYAFVLTISSSGYKIELTVWMPSNQIECFRIYWFKWTNRVNFYFFHSHSIIWREQARMWGGRFKGWCCWWKYSQRGSQSEHNKSLLTILPCLFCRGGKFCIFFEFTFVMAKPKLKDQMLHANWF